MRAPHSSMASVVVVVDLLDYFRFVQGLTWDFVASSEEPPVVRFVEASTVLPTATASRGCKAFDYAQISAAIDAPSTLHLRSHPGILLCMLLFYGSVRL